MKECCRPRRVSGDNSAKNIKPLPVKLYLMPYESIQITVEPR